MPGRGRVAEMKGRGTAGSDQGAGKEDRPATTASSDNNTNKSNNPPQEKQDKKEDWYEEAMANAERDLAEDAEWKRIQENTFTRWVNEHLRQAGTSINDLETDFSNGLKLIALLEVLSGKKMPKHNKKPTFRSQKLENVSIALKFLETEGVHLVNIDSTHITDCKLKLIMGLIWTLILHYSISMPMYDGPELGGHVEEKTPKQRLLGWMQNKIPGVPINNFTSDWTDGVKVGALVDSVAPGLCPDWEDWDPNEPIRNATEAMDLADNWLGVPKLLTPEEIINPNVDEQSMMTYLSQFPNAKVKEGAPFREKALASKVRAHGPGLEPTGNVAKAPAKFTVETFGAGDGELSITVKGPDGTDYKVDKTYNNDRKKSYSCSYFPDKEGDFTVPILYAGRNIPKSPFQVQIEGFAGDANKVTVAGPGVEPEGVVANRPTDFDIFTAGAGRGKPEVIVLDPHGLKDAIPVKITPTGNDVYHCEYMPSQLGVHSVNVFFAGNPILDSPFGVRVGPASNPNKVHASGRGLQPQGVRAQELVDFKVFTEGAGEGTASVKIIGPGGIITPTTSRNIDPHTIEYKYTPERDGRYRVMITWAGKEIQRSPFEVNVSPLKSSKIKAYGPGLQGGVVDMPALFTVDTCGETGSLGFSIEGPSQAKINCKDNGDGSADVDYVPTVAGEYAVHILCDNEDIPGSPYMAQILPKTDYDPGKVKCYGPGLEEVVQPNEETHFTIDAREAGKAPLDVLFMDDYGEVKPLWKDENGVHDPKQGGILAVKLLRAKELIKADLIGKSDPYAVIKHGAQKFTTKVIKNSQEPEWNYEAQVTIPDQGDTAVTIELFDSDKLGKDKSLGVLSFDTGNIVKEKVIEQGWYTLAGVKSGQVLMSADFVSASPTLAKDARPEHQRKMSRKMSHKNLDVRRPILEKKSEGMFECAYTPRKTQKLVICVNYGGVAVPDSPFRVTVDDPTDPNKVKVYGKGVEDGNKTGKPVEFTVDCKEAGPGDLAINITDDKGNDVPIQVKDNADHTFNIQYNPKKNGPHIIDVKYDGRDIPQSPITVNVKTDIDLRKIKVLGLNDEVFVDCTNDFDVDTSALPSDVTPNIGCSIKCPDGSNLKDMRVEAPRPDTAGKANVSYTPNKEGKHEVNVTCDGDPIHGSPFKIKAKKGSDPKKVKAYGPGLEKGICHEPNQFTIETRNAGKGDLGLSIEGPAEAKMTCKDNRDGSCNVDYTPMVPGNYDIFVKLEDKNIPGSPFSVPVIDLSENKLAGSDAANPMTGLTDLPNGKLNIKVIKAKELIKADLIGKSDPYVQISYGTIQKFKTHTVKNSLEPKWNYELELNVPEAHYTEVKFEVFDADKLGKDKSLGVVNIDLGELASINDAEGRWFTLTGVKSGKILLSADFIDSDGDDNGGDPTKALSGSKKPGTGADDDEDSKSGKSNLPRYGKLPAGRAQVYLVKAKELIKADLIGKSDPYAKLTYGTQVQKTPTVKNTLEPKWDYCANFDVPEGDKRNVAIEVFDSDKLGKDKSLGKVEVDLADLVNNEDEEGQWYPLIGVKSGKVLLFADFQEEGTYDPNDPSFVPHNLKSGGPDDGPDSKLGGGGKGLRDKLGGDGGKGDGLGGNDDDDGDSDLPSGVAKIKLIKAADLVKADIIGKSDPYAVLTHGNQKDKTKTVKNSQDPVWNHETEFKTPDNNSRTFNIEVFDSDKIGKDKSLGKLSLDIIDVLELDGQEGKWFPLAGVKTGKVLLSADFLDDLGRHPSEILPGLLKNGDPRRGSTSGSRKGSKLGSDPSDDDGIGGGGGGKGLKDKLRGDGLGRNDDDDGDSDLPSGVAKIKLIKAADLIKADIIGKSDPYAVLTHGNQKDKTKTVKNSQDPVWNHETEFKTPDNNSRTFNIEVFDSDKIGKDKSLGKLSLDIIDVLELDGQEGKWFPLAGVKTGKVLLSADFLDDLGRHPSEILPGLLKNGDPRRGSTSGSRKGSKLGSDPSNNDGIGRGDDGDDAGKKKHPSALNGDVPSIPASALPSGKAKIKLIKAKELIQADKNSKSDPYAMLLYGRQIEKTKVVQNSHEPEWNHEAEFDFPEGNERSFRIELFDSDKVGRDSSLGHLDLDITDVLALDGQTGKWFPLSGVASGKVLLSADFIDDLGRNAGDILNNLLKGLDPDGNPARKSSRGPLASDDLANDQQLPKGVATINLIKAKNLMKIDPNEKTHPYALLVHGKQMEKTKTIKNTTEPQWDHKAEFQTPDGNAREFFIEVFDSEKYDKDQSLGTLCLDITEVLKMDINRQAQWFPLSGADSGEVLLSADFLDELGRRPEDVLKDLLQNPNNRKGSASDPLNKYGHPTGGADNDNVVRVNIIKAKDLIKSDLIGKSDPYAMIKCGKQQDKTPVVKNTQNPEWNHTTELIIPVNGPRTISIEVFDHDKIGKDKSLGKVDLDLADLEDIASVEGDQGRWFPLTGVKSGQILLSADILEQANLDGQSAPLDSLSNKDRNKSLSDQGPNDGKARVNLIKAKDLINTDLKGKSDPYALIKYGSQKFKTPTVKNSLEPEWDCEVEFDYPEGDENTIKIEVFDEDKLGKDKSLGTLDLPVEDLAAMDPESGYWFPLSGVKSGEILLSGDIAESFGDYDDDDNVNKVRGKSLSGADDPYTAGVPSDFADQLPEGQVNVKVIKAKDLIKSDVFGKSDPYAVLKFGGQKDKTPVAKNTQNPEWNHESSFEIPDGPDQTMTLEVFDSDKIGKDKSLGKLDLDIQDLLSNDGEGNWYPLQGVKSGQILLSSDFLPLDALGGDGVRGGQGADASNENKNGKKKSSQLGSGLGDDIPEGVVHLDLVKAKDLDNEDKKSKSDPYAVLKYGKQKAKTNTIKNTQNPQWNFSTDFKVPDGKENTINIEIFDNDRFGRDKSLGKLDLDVDDLFRSDLSDGKWYPLSGSKAGQVFIASDFLAGDSSARTSPDKSGQAMGGKGSGPADPSKVQAYGPGLEPGQVMPGKPAVFTVDSSKTGPAPIEVDIETDGRVSSRKPSLSETGPGKHDVTYVPPPIGHPYQIGVKYGGEDIPGSPFEMTSNADTSDVIGDGSSRKNSAAPDRKESKIGISVNPDDANNLGKINIGLIAAKDLPKTDLVGKSDPYAILSHGNQKFKTDTMKNTQNPEFNYDAVFNVPDNGDSKIKIDLLDADRFGKDKLLGSANIDIDDVMTQGTIPPTWYPLKGAKSGQVLVSANFDPSSSRYGSPDSGLQGVDGRKSSSDLGDRKSSKDNDSRRSSQLQNARKPSGGAGGASALKNKLLDSNPDDILPEDLPEGTLHVDVLGAKNLPKTDLIGKSDPYAEIALGDQVYKTPTVKNSQNPEWNFGADFDLDGNQPTDVELNVFDQDKLGKDKPLGSALLPVADLLERSLDPNSGPTWVPLAGVKSGEVLVDTNFTPLDDSSRRMSGHGTGKFRNPSKQDSSASLLGDEGDGTYGGGKGLKDKLKDPKSRNLSKQGSSGSLLGDEEDDGTNGGGGRGLKDKLKDPNSRRKPGDSLEEDLIPGNLHLELLKAENLPKSDLIGKSDPYAVISFDDEKHKTKTVKNNQNPEWNFELDVPIDEHGPKNINIDVFDKDRIGKDKLLGSTNLNVADLQNGNDLDKEWMPLDGKSGKIQVSTDFSPDGLSSGSDGGLPSHLQGKKNSSGRPGNEYDPLDSNGKSGSRKGSQYDPEGVDPRSGSRKGSQYDPDGVDPRSGSRKGSQYDPDGVDPRSGSRKGSQYDPDGVDPRSGSGSRKGSQYDPSGDDARVGNRKDGKDDGIPAGNVHLALHEAEGLGKGDLIGKGDPYAVISYQDDKLQTPTVKNSQNPKWNFDADIPVNEDGSRNIDIDVYDKDRFGKDKHLGSTSLDINDLLDNPLNEEWLPLDGSKTGKLKVSADFSPDDSYNMSSRKSSMLEESYSRKTSTMSEVYSRKSSEVFSRKQSEMSVAGSRKQSEMSIAGSRRTSEMSVSGSRKQSEVSVVGSRRQSEMSGVGGLDGGIGDMPIDGHINLNVHGAKDLIKKDLIGKSDPYAVLTYGNDQLQSQPVKNSQDPQWEFQAQLPVDENSPDKFNIEVFDKDRFGKDKSLGNADFDIPSIANGEILDRQWVPLDGVKSGKIQVSADYEPEDGALSASRKSSSQGGSLSLKQNLDGVPDDSYLYGSDSDPSRVSDGRKGSQYDPYGDDPRSGSGSRKGSQYDPYGDDPRSGSGSRKGSQYDPNGDDPRSGSGSRRGSQYDPNDPRSGSGSRKGSQYDPNGDDPRSGSGSRKGSQYDPNGDDPRSGSGSRKGSQYDPNGDDSRSGSRKGSQLDSRSGGGALSLKKKLEGNPEDTYLYGSDSDPLKGQDSRKGSQYNPDNDYSRSGSSSRKGSQYDPDASRSGSRKGSQYDADDDYSVVGSRRGSQFDPESSKSGSRKGSSYDPDDVEYNNRKNSGQGGAQRLKDDLGRQKSGMFPSVNEDDAVPIGNVHLELTKAKNLIKTDMIGKSDPYAVISYGDESVRTKTVKNDLNPDFNFETDIPVDPNGPRNIKIQLFDDDKLGKDKPLGSADIDIPSLRNNANLKDAWIPLDGVKNGQIQVSADFTPYDEQTPRKPSKSGGKLIPEPERDGMRNRGGSPRNDDAFGSAPNQRKPSDNKQQAPGLIHLNIVQAKDLIKADMIGKSDPYAVVTYGDEQIKTNTVKNNLNPHWNFEADIPYNPNYSDTLKIEIFDDDKLGKNKPLGSTILDIPSLANNDPLDEVWIPLSDVKSGQIQVSAEYVPSDPDNMNQDQYRQMSPIRDSGSLGAPRNAKSPVNDKLGTIKLDLLMAKDLIKTDLVGKSDPYAIITHGDQRFKSDIKKNTQNPEWNIECEIEVPDGNDRNISIELYDSDKFGKDKFLGKMNMDIAKIMNLGNVDEGWYPLDGVKQGQICVGANFVPEIDESSTIIINQKFTETRRTSKQLQEVSLNRIPIPSTGGSIDAAIRTPSGKVDIPNVQDDGNGTLAIKYQPSEEGMHYLDVRYNNDHVQGSPFKFHVTRPNNGKASAYGPGLTHGVCGEPALFTVSTKGAGAGGLHLAVEGPSKADITCNDNKDGTVDVSYLPTAPGEYKITAKFADEHIPGSPFTCKITGEGKKRNQISVGSSSELQLPGNLTETDLRSLKAYIESPSGVIEQCFLKKLPRGNIGISFTPREVGEHLVSVQKNGKHITNSPFKIVVNAQEVGDASRVKVTGDGLIQGKTHVYNRFMINTKSAGYGGLSLSIEGPSKAEIDCKDNEDGTLDVDYKPTEPGFYIINIKFADSHVPGSPFQVPISGEGSEKITENIKRMREAVPVTEVGSQCRLTFKMPGIYVDDLEAMVTSPSGKSTKANVSEEEEGLYAVNFVPYELGIHTVTVRYRDVDIPGSPFQFTVGPLQDSGAHRVHAGGTGLERGVEGEPAEFNVWTREAGPGSLAISVEGPSKAQIDFLDRKDGSCYVSYVVDEPGEYSVGIRFNDQHIPLSPYKVFIIPKSDHADKVKISNLDDELIALNAPQSFLLNKNGASGTLQCKMVSPTGREDDCFMSQVGPDEYSVRFVPKEEGYHYLHAKLNGVHVPGSPFKIKVGGEGKKDGSVRVFGQGLERIKTGEKASFVIDTSNVGAGTLSVTVDGPSKVDMDCNEVSTGYEVSYTPCVPGDYFVTVKYNGKNVEGSPFKVTATGGVGVGGAGSGGGQGAKNQMMQRRESSSMTMETIQRTMIRQESSMFHESSSTMSSSRSSSRPIPIQPSFDSDAGAVTCKGPGIERPLLGKQNSFSVDCSRAGNNVLFVGIYGPEKPCDEVYVKHQGDRKYGVSYKLIDPGQYILYVKWGDQHVYGSPFHIEV